MSCFRVHRHAVDHGVEILALQMIVSGGLGERGEMGRRLSGEHRGDVDPPLLQLGQALRRCRRPAVIGDVVDFATEAVERKHCLALLLRQNAHGGIEGAVRRRRRLRAHAVAFARIPTERIIAEPRKRAAPSPPTSAKPALPRWTRSLSGSRLSRSRASRCASAWIAAISAPSRTSRICGMSGAPRVHEFARTAGKLSERAAQGWRRLRRIQHLHGGSVRGERIERQIDAIEPLIVLSAILQMIDDLQRRA